MLRASENQDEDESEVTTDWDSLEKFAAVVNSPSCQIFYAAQARYIWMELPPDGEQDRLFKWQS